ncbi:MAG TPA: lysophospholipid acyltransferase family protein [Geomonas sp.]|nr:lysophospholipid acyltransferase family protein [Geomonas sp.]
MSKKIRWNLETALFLSLSFAMALVPDRLALLMGSGLGRLFFHLLKDRRRVAIENIADSLPFFERQPGWQPRSAHAIALETFQNLGRCAAEACKLYHGRGRHLIEAVEFRGMEHYREAMAKGKGLAFITAHCGNWELMALSFGVRHHELSVVARPLDNPFMNAVAERIRKAYGNGIIYKSGALRSMFAAFKRQEIVGMLIDQAVHPNDGILIDFLGRPAWTSRLPALIARKSGAPMIPIFIHREGNTQVVTMYPEYVPSDSADPEICAAEDAAGLARYLERYITEHPSQWYWVHKRWKRAPAPEPAKEARVEPAMRAEEGR